MAIDPTTLAPGRIEHGTGGTAYVGESATRLFQVRTVIRALELEMRTGLRMSRRFNTATVARRLTGHTTRSKPQLLQALRSLETQLAAQVTITTEDTNENT